MHPDVLPPVKESNLGLVVQFGFCWSNVSHFYWLSSMFSLTVFQIDHLGHEVNKIVFCRLWSFVAVQDFLSAQQVPGSSTEGGANYK